MRNRARTTRTLLTIAASLAAGCADPIAPNAPPRAPVAQSVAGASSLQAPRRRGIDGQLARLAREIPGFGGMFYDEGGKLNVYVARPRSGVSTMSADIAGRLRASGVATQSVDGAVVREGAYDYLQLSAWAGRLPQIFHTRGIVFTDVDEAANRLRVGISPAASWAAAEQALARLGVPREAVLISRVEMRPLATLRDRVRPAVGGLQIAFPSPSRDALGACTLGFNARIPAVPDARFFVTASHCSDVPGGNQQTPYYQPLPSDANRVAVEYRDPAYGSAGGLCPDGFRCRFSDALLARYRPAVESPLGAIARTTFATTRIGSIEIDADHPRWTVVDELPFPFAGMPLNKVGIGSGWTRGAVLLTCADFAVAETDVVQLCQDVVLGDSRPGDSGAPVFQRAGDDTRDVLLAGILWGGGVIDGAPVFAFSSMENIELELGPLTTSRGSVVASGR